MLRVNASGVIHRCEGQGLRIGPTVTVDCSMGKAFTIRNTDLYRNHACPVALPFEASRQTGRVTQKSGELVVYSHIERISDRGLLGPTQLQWTSAEARKLWDDAGGCPWFVGVSARWGESCRSMRP